MWRPESGRSNVRLAKNGPADGVGYLVSIALHGEPRVERRLAETRNPLD